MSSLPLLSLLLLLLLTCLPAYAQSITVAAVGDIMMGSDYPEPRLPPRGGRDLLARAAPLWRGADLVLANLEGPLLEGGEPAKVGREGRSYLFRTPPSYAKNLKRAGISLVSLANNHSHDFGRAGLASTREALSQAGVAYAGKEGKVAQFQLNGLKVGVLALGFGPPPRSIVHPGPALEEVALLAQRFDILILTVHAGAEGRDALHVSPGMEYFLNEPRGDLVRFAHDAIDRGAALVVGHGPHVPRALELYRGRLIAYSLGNFATYYGVSRVGESGYAPILTVELAPDGSFLKGRLHSLRQKEPGTPSPDPQQRALKLVRRLSEQDFPDSPLVFGSTGELSKREP